MPSPLDKRWLRGVVLALAMIAAVFVLTVIVPLPHSTAGSHLRMLYLPGLFLFGALCGFRPHSHVDFDLMFLIARAGTLLFYALAGFSFGAAFRRLRTGAVACAVLLALALAGAAVFDLLE
ncbi:MAG: hypothetical protein AMK75_05325 [Planctomycetes bacterium SM23_65]|nr:MAG: hypothetical protein AMK75_05325 [Planctomycetes bacterium SM23_65]